MSGSAIPRTLLEDAKSPTNVGAHIRLIKSISPRNYTLDVVATFLHHLQPVLLERPENVSPREVDDIMCSRAGAAWLAVGQGLYSCLGATTPGSRMREATMTEIISNIDGILAWCAQMLHVFSSPISRGRTITEDMRDPTTLCEVLLRLVQLDPRFAEAMYATPTAARFSVIALVQFTPEGTPYMPFEGFGGVCKIIDFFGRYSFFNGSRRLLLDVLCEPTSAGRRIRRALLDSTLSRLVLVASLDRQTVARQLKVRVDSKPLFTGSAQDAVMSNLLKLCGSIIELCMESPLLLDEVLRSQYPTALCRALEKWIIKESEPGSKTAESRFVGYRVLTMTLSMLDYEGSLQKRRSVRALQGMIDGGLIPLIAEGLKTLRVRHPEWAYLGFLIRFFHAHCIHPDVAPKAYLAIRAIDDGPGSRSGGSLWTSDKTSCWGTLVFGITAAADPAPRVGSQVGICDNLNCPSSRRSTKKSEEYKTCSGCHAVVYCSVECQKADWEMQHRGECMDAAADYRALEYNNSHYPYRLRLFHTRHLSRGDMQNLLLQIEGEPRTRASEQVIVIDLGSDMDPRPDHYSAAAYPFRHILSLGDGWDGQSTHYFDERVARLLRECTKDSKVQLVEGVFRYGEKEVFNMIKFVRTDSGLKPVSSVARVAPLRKRVAEENNPALATARERY